MLRDNVRDDFEREHRFLLLFTPAESDPRYREQMEVVRSEAEELRENDVVAVSLFAWKGGRAGEQNLDMSDVAAIRTRYRIEEAEHFAVILVGKDGRMVFDTVEPVSAMELLRAIDAGRDE